MTVAANTRLNPRKYGRLLARTLPKAIETEDENDRMLEVVNEIMAKGEDQVTPEEDALLELLFTLIEKFEDEHYQLNASTPHSILRELMEARGVGSSTGQTPDQQNAGKEAGRVLQGVSRVVHLSGRRRVALASRPYCD
jgi:antitoxin component HigA of HigAB toxin-antitoxin module